MSVSVQSSFRRSVNLVRDFYGIQNLEDYILTSKGHELLERIFETLNDDQIIGRAWTLTGPYGGGKSAFALFLTHLLRGNSSARSKLKDSDEPLFHKFERTNCGAFCPVLVVGSREPLDMALLRGLFRSAEAFLKTYARHRGKPTKKVQNFRESLREIIQEAKAVTSQEISGEIVVDLYQRTAAAVHTVTKGGLLLIIDELGKFLEYSALYPERSDLYLLQILAEKTTRTASSEDQGAPILLLTILHQAFDRYAGRLSAIQRDDWRKVQGRFEDFAFIEPVSETLRLLAQAVIAEGKDKPNADDLAMIDKLLLTTSLPPGNEYAQIRQDLASALPLHPAVSLIVGPLFRRMAQNKRSLFAFLASGEPNSFLDLFPSQPSEASHSDASSDDQHQLSHYRLDHLYDYLVDSVGTALFSERIGRLWAETDATLSRLKNPQELTVRCVKQIALLSFAGPLAGLPPTAEVLSATVGTDRDTVTTILDSLKEERMLSYHPFKEEYHIWQGSDFDLDASLQKARKEMPARTPLAKLLANSLPPPPMVARRHSFRTGTTRIFEVLYASDETWSTQLDNPSEYADGRIIYVLPEQDGDHKDMIESIQKLVNDPLILVAIPDGVTPLREVVRELSCLEWVRNNDIVLQGDDVARQDVDQQLADLTIYVEQRLTSLLINDEGANPCSWIYQGELFRLQNERSLQDKLSQICDAIFYDAPEILSELLNRNKPSSSAVKGLKQLLMAMLEHGSECRLKIDKHPAEYGMYASILQATGIHRSSDNDSGHWHFAPPDSAKYPGCKALWDKIIEILHSAKGQRVSVKKIYDVLCHPPYGVRSGILPVFLFAVYKSAEDEIAFYEHGSFCAKIDFQTIERFLKSPDNFEVQWVEIIGSRAELLQQLAPLIGLPESAQKPLPFVLRILKRIHGLPPYVRRTAQLSTCALNVREALHRATEPTTLLFEDLPQACGINSFLEDTEISKREVQNFSARLMGALRELTGAYDEFLRDLQKRIAVAFRLRSKTSDDCRSELAERAFLLLPYANDTKLRAFLIRATDEVLDTQSWYESVSSLMVNRPPVQWRDEDLSVFINSLHEISHRFFKLEPIAFEAQRDLEESEVRETNSGTLRRIRLSVTEQYEDEHEQVISIHPEDSDLIERVYEKLESEMAKENVAIETKIVALARLSRELLIQRKKVTKPND